jgi:hypothetical protein
MLWRPLRALQLHIEGRRNKKNMIHSGVLVDQRPAVLNQNMGWLSRSEFSSYVSPYHETHLFTLRYVEQSSNLRTEPSVTYHKCWPCRRITRVIKKATSEWEDPMCVCHLCSATIQCCERMQHEVVRTEAFPCREKYRFFTFICLFVER